MSCFLLLTTFLACSDPGTFRLHGDFTHLRQVDFFVYSTDGGLDKIDTIHVIDGQFDWKIPLQEEATFYVIFPNMSEQVIFAEPGQVIKMKGDAQQLRMVSITGSEDNEQLTDFRTQHNGDSQQQYISAANTFIQENPDSRVSTYLRRQLTLLSAAQSPTSVNKKLPEITLPPDGLDSQQDTLYIKKDVQPILLIFWASWKHNSQEVFYPIRKALRKTEKYPLQQRFKPICISLDSDVRTYHNICRYDSLTWDSRCYKLVWNTPLVKQLGVKDIPYYVLTDKYLKITASGTDWKRDIEPTFNKLITQE